MMEWKQDDRPKRNDWAPGGYLCTCMDCDEKFIGDKRALECADCAYAEKPEKEITMKTIYFAHPVWTYGTPTEAAIIRDLEATGWTVVNPNAPEHQAAYAEKGMAYFTELVAGCDALCYLQEYFDDPESSDKAGHIVGAGVAKEILEAIVHGKFYWNLTLSPEGKWTLTGGRFPACVMTVEQTRAHRAEKLAELAA